MFQRWSPLLLNGCDRTAGLFVRLALTLGVLALLSLPVILSRDRAKHLKPTSRASIRRRSRCGCC